MESLLIPAVVSAMVWSIDTQPKDALPWDLCPEDWEQFARLGGWWAFGTFIVTWLALVAVMFGRRWVLRQLSTSSASRNASAIDSELRGRLLFLLSILLPALWATNVFVHSVITLQLLSILVGTWIGWGWREVERKGDARLDALIAREKQNAAVADEWKMFGSP
ncbi:hypothetical protein KIH27_18555 [Mycobacterium sp. M1]|uniref:Transmembrane protein n=1 Tax=Mycolicibacter acidiphilus TaxID=2835306 RepID=A0ABS5RMQ2_9MYCO|nr:hypothetical protein [Mycolicibacter acidiphilus]MBS9535591.1 hypothetical protein [Mycolicibacter acidiphilus]